MATAIRGCFLVFYQLLDAFLADILSAVGNQAPGGSAEEAGRLKFLQNDPVIFHKNLQFIPFFNVQRAAQLNRQNNSAQIINLANNSRRLHLYISPFDPYCCICDG